MAKFLQISKSAKLELFEIIRFQLVIHCALNKITMNETEFSCLALLGLHGKIRLMDFCRIAASDGLLGNPTAVNNCLARVERSKMFIKEGVGKKVIYLNPDLGIQTKGNILLTYKIIRIEADKSQGVDNENSGAVEFAGAVR